MQYALRVLGYRARSEREMRHKLERKGFSPRLTDLTLMELTRLGLLDDREFARNWVSVRTAYGPVRLRYELRQKGIDPALAEEMIGTLRSEEDDAATAWRLARKAQRGEAVAGDRAVVLRIRRLLQRRGFARAVIERVCSRLRALSGDDEGWPE